jgi:hypothetical protein
MVTLTLTPQQFDYLRQAVKRDLESLQEMAPWDIDDNGPQHKRDVQLCKGMGKLLDKVEQEQVIRH